MEEVIKELTKIGNQLHITYGTEVHDIVIKLNEQIEKLKEHGKNN